MTAERSPSEKPPRTSPEPRSVGDSVTTQNADSNAPSITKDDAFHVLQNGRRRAVLRYLFEHEDTDVFRMDEVAEEVAAWEHETPVRLLNSDERQRVYIALYQTHLPKLDKMGVIEYEQNRGRIARTPLTTVFDPYVDDGLYAERYLTVGSEPTNEGDESRRGFADLFSPFLE